MKKLALISLASLLLLAGCCTYTCPQGKSYRVYDSPWSVVNNTGFTLDVFVNSEPAGTLEAGQVLPVRPTYVYPDAVVSVVGRTRNGTYVGASSHRFFRNDIDAWLVSRLQVPELPR
jgi:hypothetical protein